MLNESLKAIIRIEVSEEETAAVMEHIHNQLVGNQDYIDCNIVLNDAVDGSINVYIFKNCKTKVPDLMIKLNPED